MIPDYDKVIEFDAILEVNTHEFDAKIESESLEFDAKLDALLGALDIEYYDGDYVVTPRKVEQSLLTKEKRMRDDVTVLAINYSEVLNIGGGLTANIGYE